MHLYKGPTSSFLEDTFSLMTSILSLCMSCNHVHDNGNVSMLVFKEVLNL